MPENALIVLLPEEDPGLCERNIELAQARREPGQVVVHVRIEKVAPPRSRLVNPRVEVAAAGAPPPPPPPSPSRSLRRAPR